jgi:hypothetical protein
MRHLYLALFLILAETALCVDLADRHLGLLCAIAAGVAGLRWAHHKDAARATP